MPRLKYSNVEINREVLAAIKRLNLVKNSSVKSLVQEIDRTRQLVITAVAENGQITPYNLQQLKDTIQSIVDSRAEQIANELSENGRRVFVKGLQVVDALIVSQEPKVEEDEDFKDIFSKIEEDIEESRKEMINL